MINQVHSPDQKEPAESRRHIADLTTTTKKGASRLIRRWPARLARRVAKS
jgi:hypothetical protein